MMGGLGASCAEGGGGDACARMVGRQKRCMKERKDVTHHLGSDAPLR